MLSTFLLGYFLAYRFTEGKSKKLIKRLKKEVNTLKNKKSLRDIETIFTEIKPKIVAVVKQQAEEQEEQEQEEKEQEAHALKGKEIASEDTNDLSIPEKARTTYISYNTVSNVEVENKDEDEDEYELDFDSFGYADKDNRDDLTKIHGIGPYIERKLNEVGIYNYDQISRLKPQDIVLITELIDFFPGRIERDNWVAQAESLNVF
jgi:predicted flap endonuclease-1-like 5' DNA nuclease